MPKIHKWEENSTTNWVYREFEIIKAPKLYHQKPVYRVYMSGDFMGEYLSLYSAKRFVEKRMGYMLAPYDERK